MTRRPTIEELHDDLLFKKIAAVEHDRIKDFVVEQVTGDNKLVPVYMVYQTLMLLTGLFFFARAIILAYRGETVYLWVSFAAVAFSFTLLVVIHELLHGFALKLAGAPRVTYGGMLRKFIFYAEADRFILGKNAFLFVALTPLVVIQLITVAGIILWFSTPFVYLFLVVMSLHSFFCAGDIALATIFLKFPGRAVYTYDNRSERISYYFVEKDVSGPPES
ncbi:MAG: DUF3267 domain-containing protein [Prolixibacteraceae bacterium]|jgi:hypothetical protein|nr:DUF3267 domain-containing protein [Prolixibacteraceae bacterium]MDI9564107.1 DUF3267 domain-containing protein [Bacteroidota bacterium]NLT00345.1 DUF3267 domain-containing protein [Bacteroidales bacterium]OQB79830.1 MAG: hypothetical protein BWX87_01828 [Bacteroidetes bacterium ADurb.Bin123]HNU76854.1 DUF3267 domain-containing protein [Prolixibacteraceae bacterium]